MEKMSAETGNADVAVKRTAPPPPPPPAFLKKKVVSVSMTNWEIAKFWRQKRMNEEDHLLTAIKAAARIRAHKLTDKDYKRFEESLSVVDDPASNSSSLDDNTKELRVGIKDWWTKSKYAYLNQPAVGSVDKPNRRASSYIPNCCNYKPSLPPSVSFGVF